MQGRSRLDRRSLKLIGQGRIGLPGASGPAARAIVLLGRRPRPPWPRRAKLIPAEKYGFAFQYPAAYELKVAVDSYFDFKKGGGTLFCLRVDDRFIEMLYQMLHPGLVVYPAGEEPLPGTGRGDPKEPGTVPPVCPAGGPELVRCRPTRRLRLLCRPSKARDALYFPGQPRLPGALPGHDPGGIRQ